MPLQLSVLGCENDDDDQHDNDQNADARRDPKVLTDLVPLLFENGAGVVEAGLASALLQLVKTHAARHDHCGFDRFFRQRRGGRSSGNCCRWRAFGFQFQFHLPEPERLAGFQNAFGDLRAVDITAVRGIQVFDKNFSAAQLRLAVMAGNGRVGDLKRVILHAANGRAFHVQLVDATSHVLIQDNKFGHSLMSPIMGAI